MRRRAHTRAHTLAGRARVVLLAGAVCLIVFCHLQRQTQIMGRASVDIIKSNAFKVSALEVEGALLQHPAVQVSMRDVSMQVHAAHPGLRNGRASDHGPASSGFPNAHHILQSVPRSRWPERIRCPRSPQECAVVGVPDPVHGEAIMALVVPKEGAAGDLGQDAAAALRAFCADKLPKYKVGAGGSLGSGVCAFRWGPWLGCAWHGSVVQHLPRSAGVFATATDHAPALWHAHALPRPRCRAHGGCCVSRCPGTPWARSIRRTSSSGLTSWCRVGQCRVEKLCSESLQLKLNRVVCASMPAGPLLLPLE